MQWRASTWQDCAVVIVEFGKNDDNIGYRQRVGGDGHGQVDFVGQWERFAEERGVGDALRRRVDPAHQDGVRVTRERREQDKTSEERVGEPLVPVDPTDDRSHHAEVG